MRTSDWVLISSLLACHSASAPSTAPNAAGDRITLERTKCFGTCVAYALTIDAGGAIAFDRTDSGATHQTAAAEPSSVRRLLASIDSAGFFDLSSYAESSAVCRKAYMTDLPSARVTVVYRARSHTVEHYLGCRAVPPALWKIEVMIDSIGQSSRFLHGNFGGPFGSTYTCRGAVRRGQAWPDPMDSRTDVRHSGGPCRRVADVS